MLVYWLMFSVPVYALVAPTRLTPHARDFIWRTICILFALIIGLRFEVGGDWSSYLSQQKDAYGESFLDAILAGNPGFAMLGRIAASLGLGIYGVNLVCGTFVMLGIYQFCRRQPQPWVALAVSVPYLIIVVAMGYTRQSVAIGLELIALVALSNRRLFHFVLLIGCAGLFHRSAVLLLPLGLLASSEKRLAIIISISIMSILLGGALLLEHYESLIKNYVVSGMTSEGAGIRVAMNSVPAAIFLLFAKRIAPDGAERRLWTWVAIFSLTCIPLVDVASTAVDRVALYFLPIQIFVFSRIHLLFRHRASKSLAIMCVIGVYGLAEWVLLNYAPIVSNSWLPYNNVAFYWNY